MNIARPAINIYVNHLGQAFIKEVLAGLEEEEVLYEVHITSEKIAEELAHKAATSSILEVGVGVDKDFVCVTLARLPLREPLLKYRTSEKLNLRLSGSNAARLAKGSKLKL